MTAPRPAAPPGPPATPWECPNHPGTWVITGACIACNTERAASGPAQPEAATPVHDAPPELAGVTPIQALAAQWAQFSRRAEAGAREWDPGTTGLPEYDLGRATGYGECAILLSAKLAPAWDALAAERDELRALISAGQPALASELLAAREEIVRLTRQLVDTETERDIERAEAKRARAALEARDA